MQPSAKISDQDIISIYTPLLAIDAVWEHLYGDDIEYEHRQIPAYLAYLLKKYEMVPHWLLLDTVRENSKVGADKAAELIAECLEAGMFSAAKPVGDPRQLLYFFTDGQKSKILDARKGEAMAYLLAMKQKEQPTNLDAGRTEENQPWYRHAMQRVTRHDDRYKSNIERIKKLRHLVYGLVLVILVSSWATQLLALTADKGGN